MTFASRRQVPEIFFAIDPCASRAAIEPHLALSAISPEYVGDRVRHVAPKIAEIGAPKELLPSYMYSPLIVARGALNNPPTPS